MSRLAQLAAVATVVLTTQHAFAESSDDADLPRHTNRGARNNAALAKGSKAPVAAARSDDDEAPPARAKPATKAAPREDEDVPARQPTKTAKRDDDGAPARPAKKAARRDDEVATTKAVKKTAVRGDDEESPGKPASKAARRDEEDPLAKPKKAGDRPRKLRATVESDVVEIADDEDEPREGERTVAAADDVEEIEAARVAKVVRAPRTTRFYFRAGGLRQTSTLGATQFELQTSLPVDTSAVGAGSGVEMQQDSIPVGVIVGYVLPVLDRRLSVETILGFPTKTRFRATGKLANESLAPMFMGLPTGIEPLGPALGEATFSPPLVTAVYRVAELGPVTPIAGAGVMVLFARDAKITNPVLNAAGDPALSITPSPGLVLQGGLELKLSRRFAARVDVKYVLGMNVEARVEHIAVTPKAIPQLGSIEVGDAVLRASVTPLVFQAGIGADF